MFSKKVFTSRNNTLLCLEWLNHRFVKLMGGEGRDRRGLGLLVKIGTGKKNLCSLGRCRICQSLRRVRGGSIFTS